MTGVAYEQNGEQRLARLRAELDGIDQELLDTLRRRIDCCVRIARHKSTYDIPMMQPGRIELVKGRAAQYGETHSIDIGFLENLYDLIIGETCRVEDLVMGNDATS
ncbi:chorismate mutase family protein [Streptomyces sp. JUS-F4]|uniref:chorismate mutase family protein n=1 Tax=Streptomyces sp. JUS-F4 TaxID=2951988 RepID=UPI002666C5B8|nr:chorismate mutase family protein [Streptomyces sp. JUS-F4]WKN18644.1 chorismate mutase family protein [Streptomyces sp. JUS-F4]